MRSTVHYNRLPIAPRKLRAVIWTLRDRTVAEGIALMTASPRVTTEPVTKLLKASLSAARDRTPALQPNELRVVEIFCNEAARLYRTRMKGRGRSSRFAKRGSHLTLTVEWSGDQKSDVRARTVNPKSEIRNPKTAEQKAAAPKKSTKRPTKSQKIG